MAAPARSRVHFAEQAPRATAAAAAADVLDDAEGATEYAEAGVAIARAADDRDADGDYDHDDDEGGGSGDDSADAGSDDGGGATAAAPARHIQRVRGEEAAGPEAEEDEAGVTFEPFHLRAEREEGYYDAGGAYVLNRKSAEEKDAWLDELDAMDPTLRRKLQAKVGAEHRRRQDGEAGAGAGVGAGAGADAGASAGAGADEGYEDAGEGGEDKPLFGDGGSDVSAGPELRARLLHIICGALGDGETVAAALRRLGAGARKRRGGSGAVAPAQLPADKLAFEALTEAADGLVRDGMVDAYSLTRAQARGEMREALADVGGLTEAALDKEAGARDVAAAATGAAAAAAAAGAMQPPRFPEGRSWQYVWRGAVVAAAEEVHGPYDSAAMNAWAAAGYFGRAGGRFVEVREAEGGAWCAIEGVVG